MLRSDQVAAEELSLPKRPTLSDVARRAGVSIATVDRALNGRLPVREETLKRIYEASSVVGYHATGLLKQRIKEDLTQYRLGLLLLGKTHPSFFQALGRKFETAAMETPGCRVLPKLGYLDWESPNHVADQLRTMGSQVDAVAAVSIDHPNVTAAVADLKSKGVPVFSILTDFAQGVRESYLGLNNRKAGGTAAWLIAKTAKKPGKVAIFVGNSRFHGHEMREIGFRAYFRERAPEFEVVHTLVNPGSVEIAYEATKALLRRHPDLVGLNVAGCGPEGVIAALREEHAGGRLTAICNENTPESASALSDEIMTMVIDTPLDRLSRELIALMIHALQTGAAHVPGQAFLPFHILVAENL
jgi:LacI family transcriptional regulator